MGAPRAIVFDLAGVLIDWDVRPLYRDLFGGDRGAVADFFSRVLTEERLHEISLGRPSAEVLDELAAAHPELEGPIYAWSERWEEMLLGEVPGTRAVLERLRERGHRTYVLGNWAREEFERGARKFPVLGTFDGVVISGDHGVMKPDPAIFDIVVERFDLDPRRSVFIDDKEENVAAGRRRGFDGIVFEDATQLGRALAERALL